MISCLGSLGDSHFMTILRMRSMVRSPAACASTRGPSRPSPGGGRLEASRTGTEVHAASNLTILVTAVAVSGRLRDATGRALDLWFFI